MPVVLSPALLSVCDAPASASKGTPACCDAAAGVAAAAATADSAVGRESNAGPDPFTADAAALLAAAGPDGLLD